MDISRREPRDHDCTDADTMMTHMLVERMTKRNVMKRGMVGRKLRLGSILSAMVALKYIGEQKCVMERKRSKKKLRS